jgi:adaptin ear-binding coat-associated protein 1/2
MDNSCLIQLIAETVKPGGVGVVSSLFAQSIVTVTEHQTLQYFLEPVVDSSRYFVLKIEDSASHRTAHIGIGFRERDDASNFTLAMQDYERSIQRQFKAEAMHTKFERLQQEAAAAGGGGDDETPSDLAQQVSKLTLKEGEKIRINLMGRKSSSQSKDTISKESKKSASAGVIPLLKKPPRPEPPAPTAHDTSDPTNNGLVENDEDEWSEFQQP